MAEYSGWSGFISMSNAQCQMWCDWETNRDVVNGRSGHYVNIILKASRTAGYTTFGDAYLKTQVGSSEQYGERYIEITSNETTYRNDTHFVEGSHKGDVDIAGNGYIDIFNVANGQANFVAKLKQNIYTITFNANGGVGAPNAQDKPFLVMINLTTSKPTRAGYTFSHWNTRSDNKGTRYNSGGQYSGNVSETLYAIWSPNPYYITYNANGGQYAPQMQTKYHGDTISLHSQFPSKQGHSFSRWNTRADGNGTSYYPSGAYSANASVILYAIWIVDSYPIYFNANGGVGAPSAQEKVYNRTLKITTSKPTRTGYTFSHWNTQSNGGGTSYLSGGNFDKDTSLMLYAIWYINKYTITYNANGGANAPSSQTKTHGTNLVLSASIPVRAGYKFLGWSDTTTGNVKYDVGSIYTSNANITLYAVWSRVQLTVTFDANGGVPVTQSKTVYQNDKIGTLLSVTRMNHKLLGWSTDKTESNIITIEYVVKQNVTLYAIWKLQANCFVKQNGKYVTGMMYRKQNETYKTGLLSMKVNGKYKGTNM